jgi:hypothetical protein
LESGNQKKITDLILTYQKHLTKKYCFRTDDKKTSYKEHYIKLLLGVLKISTPENFIAYLSLEVINNTLAQHRDFSIIQKIGQFFKRHNKTEGTLLVETIFSTLNENITARNTLSI